MAKDQKIEGVTEQSTSRSDLYILVLHTVDFCRQKNMYSEQ